MVQGDSRQETEGDVPDAQRGADQDHDPLAAFRGKRADADGQLHPCEEQDHPEYCGRKQLEEGVDRMAEERIGLLGHSEGAAIAPLVASRDPAIAFVVLLAGAGVPGADVIVEQVRAIAQAAGMPAASAEQSARMQRGLMDVLLKHPQDATARAEISAYFAARGAPAPAESTVAQLLSPWYRHFIAHDPRPALRALKVPVLALLGGKDIQVTAAQNLPALKEALRGNPSATVEELPGLNHLFQTATTGAVDEYATITETIAPVVLEHVGEWILANARK